MPDVPDAITNRLTDIDAALGELRSLQQRDSRRRGHLFEALVKRTADLEQRRIQIKQLKMQRRTLMFAVDAIEGRIIDLGTVEAPTEELRTKPFVEEVVVANNGDQSNGGDTTTATRKQVVYQTIVRLGHATSADLRREIEEPALRTYLGSLSRDGLIRRDPHNSEAWVPSGKEAT